MICSKSIRPATPAYVPVGIVMRYADVFFERTASNDCDASWLSKMVMMHALMSFGEPRVAMTNDRKR